MEIYNDEYKRNYKDEYEDEHKDKYKGEYNIIQILDKMYQNNKLNFSNLNIDNFIKNFSPFIHLVNYWSQILGLLLYKCNDPEIRRKIVKNLYEENCEKYTHVDTFMLFIKECNINNINVKYNLEEIPMNDVIKEAINSITHFVINNTFDDSCQMLGTIEYIYHLISIEINNYIYNITNIKPEFHYSVHEILDIEHSYDLFNSNKLEIDLKNLEFGAHWIIKSISSLINCDI
jgi:hypothetical protein